MLRADTRVAGGTKAALVIPRIGLGTGGLKGAIAVGVVRTALEVGYRHLDTAEQYMNEDQVGEGLLASGVPRTAVVLTSKYQSLHADQGGKLGCGFGVRGDVFRSLNASLARLRTTFLDVYLVHFPTPVVLRNGQLVEAHCGVGTMLAERRATVWREMIEARRTGLVRAIGVSNWGVAELAELEAADEYPTVYQGEFSPFYRNEEVRRYLAARGSVTFVAYGALLRSLYVNWWGATRASKRFRAEFEKLASQRGVSTVQLMLQYSTQHGHAVITKSSSAVHLKSNLQATCNLTEADLELLNSAPQLPKGYGHAFGPFAQSVPGALKPRASTTTSASRNPGERGEWRILESLNGQGTDLKHPQPMRAVVRGEAAAVVVRNAFSAQDVSDVLQRLHERRLWESDGSLGSAALAAKSHGKPFRNYPYMTEIGHTIHTFGLGTRNWQRATTAFREQYVGSLFNNIVDPWSRFQTILNALARGSGKVVAPPKNFTGLPGSRGIPGIFRANRPGMDAAAFPAHFDGFTQGVWGRQHGGVDFPKPRPSRSYAVLDPRFGPHSILSAVLLLQSDGGPPGSGGTTLYNASLLELQPEQSGARVNGTAHWVGVHFDDAAELQCLFARDGVAVARPHVRAGDLYLFSSSRVHEVAKVLGSAPRLTLQSFLAWDDDAKLVMMYQ